MKKEEKNKVPKKGKNVGKSTSSNSTKTKNNSKNENKNVKNKKNIKNQTNNRNKKASKILIRVILVILVIGIIAAGIFAYKVSQNGGGLKGTITTVMGGDQKKSLSEIQVLLLGESTGLTDTIIACSYNPNTQEATMLSIPRDTFVGSSEKRATASDKINAVFQGQYPEKTLEAVNEVTGLNIPYYVLVDTKALQELVDAIGGVEFYVPMDMDYDDTSKENYLRIHLKEGMQTINGEQAEQLLRFRHNNDGSTYPASYGEQDIGRMRTQREFIMAALKQTLKPENIFKIGEFIDIANRNVKTNLPIELIKDYIPYAVEFNTENIITETLPGESVKLNGVWLYRKNDLETQQLINELFFDGPTEEELEAIESQKESASDSKSENVANTTTSQSTATPITVQVLNGSGDASALAPVVTKLKENGFTVVAVGNTTSTKKTTITNRTKQSSETASKIQSLLGTGTIKSAKKLNDFDFSIVIGKDYLSN